MWSQFPSWFLLASALLGCGCIATVLFVARDAGRRLKSFGEGSASKLDEHDRAFGQLKERVEDMAGRLTHAATERRELTRSNRKLSVEAESRASDLHAARGHLSALEGELARLREQAREASEIARIERTALEEREQTIAGLQTDLANRARQVEAVEERAQRLEEVQGTLSARVSELEGTLLARDRALQESAEKAEVDAASRQELATRVERQDEELLRLRRRAVELEATASARVTDLEAELARRETALDERTAAFESLQRDLDARVRDAGAALERCERLERQVELDRERDRAARETQSALALRATELERDLALRQDGVSERSGLLEQLEADLSARTRELEASEERFRELALETRRLQEEEQERRRRELEVEGSHENRVRELESRILELESELEGLRVERTQLSTRCATTAREFEATREELRDQEHRLIETEEHWQASRFEIQRCFEAIERERAPIDPLVEGRILSLFRRTGTPGTELLPDGYSSGLEEGDLEIALRNLFGGVEPLSADSMAVLAGRWRKERAAWKRAPFQQQAVYLWADGIFVKAGLGEEGRALLCVFAAFVDGSRGVVAVEAGKRESKDDWLEILRNLERRGMGAPRLVVADETLGLFEALGEIGWDCPRQRCWSRRTDEVIALLPKSRQTWAANQLRRLTNAESRSEAKDRRDEFVKRCGARHSAAAERLRADWRQMTNFFSFPKSHWPHLRTTSVVESPFAAIRLRCAASRPGPATPDADSMLWKLLVVGENTFRKLNAPLLLPGVARGEPFVDGLPDERAKPKAA